MNVQRRLKIAVVVSMTVLSALFVAGLQAQHPAYKPHKVTGVPTYKNSGEVGNVLFSLEQLPREQKEYRDLLDKLEVAQGNPRTVNFRAFLPCTLREAMKYITAKEPTASNFKTQMNIKLVQRGEVLETGIGRSDIKGDWPERNSIGNDTAGAIQNKLRSVPRGEYVLNVDGHITYDYVANKATGKTAPSNLLLAAGKLPIAVK